MVDQIKVSGLPEKDAIGEGDFVVGNVGATTDATGRVTIPALRERLNIGDQDIVGDVDITGNEEVSGSHKAATYQGNGALITSVPSSGVGGNSSETSLSLICNSANGTPAAKVVISKYSTDLVDIDENSIRPKTGIPYSHDDDAIPFAKDLDLQGFLTVRDQGKQDIQPFQALSFDGVSGNVLVPDHASYSELFKNGGTYICPFKAVSVGEDNAARFFEKGASFRFRSATGKLQFSVPFSGTAGTWETVEAVTMGVDSTVGLAYDGSDVANDPVIYLDGVPLTISETSTPSGTISTDVGSDLYFGNRSDDTKTFDGILKGELLLNYEYSADQLKAATSNPNMAIDPADEGGSNVAQNVSNCEQGTNGAGIAAIFDTFDGVSATGFHADKTTTGAGSAVCGSADEIAAIKGKTVIADFDITEDRGTLSTSVSVNLNAALGGSSLSSVAAQTPAVGHNTLVFLSTGDDAAAVIQFFAGTSADVEFTVSNLKVTAQGCTYRAKPQGIGDEFWVDDMNGNDGTITGGTKTNPQVYADFDCRYSMKIPRLTTTQKNALTAVNGMQVYDTTLNKFQGYENGAWTSFI